MGKRLIVFVPPNVWGDSLKFSRSDIILFGTGDGICCHTCRGAIEPVGDFISELDKQLLMTGLPFSHKIELHSVVGGYVKNLENGTWQL